VKNHAAISSCVRRRARIRCPPAPIGVFAKNRGPKCQIRDHVTAGSLHHSAYITKPAGSGGFTSVNQMIY